MSQPKLYTIENFITPKAEDLFTDREEPRKAFWDVYEAMVPGDVSAIGFYGVGGIGKSTLIDRVKKEIDEKIVESKGLDHITYSFEDYTTKEAFLFRLSREMCLRIKGLSFPIFDAAIAKIYNEGSKDLEKIKKEVEKSLLDNPVVDIALSIVNDMVPGTGTISKIINGMVTLSNKAKIEKEEDNGRDAILYSLIRETDSKTLINEHLHKFFVYDVGKHMIKRTRPLVIFLDGYEQYIDDLNDAELSVGKDYWIHTNYMRLVDIPNTLWVVAGRERINWNEDVMPKENLHLMGNLSDKDSVQYFIKAGIVDRELALQLCELSHGTPVYMDICVKTYHEIIKKNQKPTIGDFGKDTSELAQRYLNFMDKPTRRLVELISWLPNVWTEQMVENIANMINYHSYLPELSIILKLSLVEAEGTKYKLHETCRDAARKVCNNAGLIKKAILEYTKKEIFNDKTKEDCWSIFFWLLEILDSAEYILFTSEELHKLINKYEEIRKYEGDYHKQVALSKRMYNIITKKKLGSVLQVRCANIYIDDLFLLGKYKHAEELAASNYDYAMKELPEESEERFDALEQYSKAKFCMDDYKVGIKLAEQHYELRKHVFGDDHLATLDSLNNLARNHHRYINYEEGIKLAEQCYESAKRVFHEEHPDTLRFLDTLAHTYWPVDYEKRKELATQCYESRKRVLGAEDSQTLESYFFLLSINDEKMSIEQMEQCYESSKRVFGENHPNTLEYLKYTAFAYGEANDYLKEKELFEKCYETSKWVLGEEHPDTLEYLRDISGAYKELGDFKKAIELGEKCYSLSKQTLGEEHSTTLGYMWYIASTYKQVENYLKAIEWLNKIRDIRMQSKKELTISITNIFHDLALIYRKMGDFINAKEMMEQRYQLAKKIIGEEHPSMIIFLKELAQSYSDLKDYTKQRELLEQCYENSMRMRGPEDYYTLEFCHDLGRLCIKLGDTERGEELMTQYYKAKELL